jgi:hypothetical protein
MPCRTDRWKNPTRSTSMICTDHFNAPQMRHQHPSKSELKCSISNAASTSFKVPTQMQHLKCGINILQSPNSQVDRNWICYRSIVSVNKINTFSHKTTQQNHHIFWQTTQVDEIYDNILNDWLTTDKQCTAKEVKQHYRFTITLSKLINKTGP